MLKNKKIFLEIIGLSLKNFKLNFFLTYFYLLIFFGLSYLLFIFNYSMYFFITNTLRANLFVLLGIVSTIALTIVFYTITNIAKKKVVFSYSNLIMVNKDPLELRSLNDFLDNLTKITILKYFINTIAIIFVLCLLFGSYFFFGKYFIVVVLLCFPLIFYLALNISFVSFKENLFFVKQYFKYWRFFFRFYILELIIYLVCYLLYSNIPNIVLVFLFSFVLCLLVYFKLYVLFAFRIHLLSSINKV